MTEEIIIDGVNVAGCVSFDKNNGHNICCYDDTREDKIPFANFCVENKDCAYKQLKRLEQENKKLKKDVQLFKCLDTFGESECHCACRCLGNEFCEDADKKINTYRSALEEIKNYLKKVCKEECDYTKPKFCGDCDCRYGQILEKVNEVLN